MSKVKVGVSMLYCLGKPFDRMVKRLGSLNTHYVEVLDDGKHEIDKHRVSILRETAKSYGLEYSVHAPFADINIASPSKYMLNASMKRLKQSMVYANMLDAKLWVFHPGTQTGISQFYPGADWKQNCRSIQELYETAEEYGLNTAIENLPARYWFFMNKPEEFVKFYRETNLPIGIAMDLGHASLEGQIEPFFNILADKIIHIHASDNNGFEDEHLGIGQGKIDWNWFSQTVRKIDYDKAVIIESTVNVSESLQKLQQLLS
jgi:sugar phosphate isomerase/epimerase